MLKPEGRIALAWNIRDERIPWVRRLGAIIGDNGKDTDPTDVLVASRHFGYVEDASFQHRQPVKRQDLRDLVLSRSNVAVMDPLAQDRVLRKVDELFDEYDRGPDGLLLPYVTRCYRAVVRPRGPHRGARAQRGPHRGGQRDPRETPPGRSRATSPRTVTASTTAEGSGDDEAHAHRLPLTARHLVHKIVQKFRRATYAGTARL